MKFELRSILVLAISLAMAGSGFCSLIPSESEISERSASAAEYPVEDLKTHSPRSRDPEEEASRAEFAGVVHAPDRTGFVSVPACREGLLLSGRCIPLLL